MLYNVGLGKDKNFILAEDGYSAETLAKCESVMCQGNGYMCIRAANEDEPSYIGPGTYVAGTFNHLEGHYCTTIPNVPDMTAMKIYINGRRVTLKGIKADTHLRYINLRNGYYERSFIWEDKDKQAFQFKFSRVVSLADKHIAAFFTEIRSLSNSRATVRIDAGIEGVNIDNPPADHLVRISESCENGVLRAVTRSSQSKIGFVTELSVDVSKETEIVYSTSEKCAKARFSFELCEGESVEIQRRGCVYTSRDRERDGCSIFCLEDTADKKIAEIRSRSFNEILSESEAEWERKIWSSRDVNISGSDRDQLALRFAVYHLTLMAPVHDNRMNIGAKGLSGPGYNGHAFWDTEIYMLPYFIFAAPDEARSLVEYRYNCLEAAREYAKAAKCRGARFPWESAWITDGEATPTWCDTGEYELHITADVAFGAYYYYMVTGDEDFMERCGYELIIDCAIYWLSRFKLNRKTGRYEIHDVIGPNEYKSHVNNNAYTNHMAYNNIVIAMDYVKFLSEEKPALYSRLDKKLGIKRAVKEWEKKKELIYCPVENEDGIIPEDDTFLSLPSLVENEIPLSLDPTARKRMGAFDRGINDWRCCKQADVVALLYLMEDLFSAETKRKNFYFYDKCCFHDSSLSLSTFSALAADLGEGDMAYKLFERASLIDIGINTEFPKASDMGVHAASLGGIWQCCVLGFGGVRRYGKELRIQPNLPNEWDCVKFKIYWHSQCLEITETHTWFSVENLSGTSDVQFLYNGSQYSVGKGITIKYSNEN